jgi:hypothetical protein
VFSTPPLNENGDLTDEQAASGARNCPLCRQTITQPKIFAAVASFQPDADKDDGSDDGLGEGSSPTRNAKRKSVSARIAMLYKVSVLMRADL